MFYNGGGGAFIIAFTSQLSNAISASILPIKPQDHNQLNQPIHRNPVNGFVIIFRFCW